MKKEKNLHEELAKRKYKTPNPLFYFIYYIVGRTHLLGAKYHPHLEVIDKLPKKGPAFIIWNHQSRRDHTFITTMSWPRRINIVCEYNEFFRTHLAWPFKMAQILPKKVFVSNDMAGVRAMREIIKQGGIVAFSPEGTSSIFGDNQPIVNGTGRFLQAFGAPIYIVTLQGSYLTNNKISADDRIGEVFGQMRLLYSSEDLKKANPEDIDKKINEEFHHDDYEWNKVHHIKYNSKGKICNNLADILYKCPRCGEEFQMEGKDDHIKCLKCGNGATMDDYYDFHPYDDKCVIPETPSAWAHYERQNLIDEIRKDPNYSFSFKTKIGYLPKDHLVNKKVTSEICGEGIYTIDHQGVHFKGTKLGEPFNFDFNYKMIQTYPMSVDVSIFSLYVDGDYYDFFPEYHCVGKVIMFTEEMHRLHVNKWKNFPWFDNMYEGRPLGIDEKEK